MFFFLHHALIRSAGPRFFRGKKLINSKSSQSRQAHALNWFKELQSKLQIKISNPRKTTKSKILPQARRRVPTRLPLQRERELCSQKWKKNVRKMLLYENVRTMEKEWKGKKCKNWKWKMSYAMNVRIWHMANIWRIWQKNKEILI